MKSKLIIIVCLILLMLPMLLFSQTFNYADALKKGIWFFDANKCGPDVDSDNVFDWRGVCHTKDGQDVGIDLNGGFHDAGDHVKFGLPQGYAASLLGWTLYEYGPQIEEIGMKTKLLSTLKYFTDYFLKSHTASDTFYYQLGDGQVDHTYWGSPEFQTEDRPTYAYADPANPASDICGITSAALTLMYLNYKDIDAAYADQCLQSAKQLYDLAKTYEGKGEGQSFYQSHSYYDDLAWAAVWLYVVEGTSSYLTEIDSYLSHNTEFGDSPYENKWTMCWDDMYQAVFTKMAELTGEQKFHDAMTYNLNYWMNDLTNTNGGLRYLDVWGSLRYASAEAMIANRYYELTGNSIYLDFAKSQIDYMLGDNPNNMSYVIGFNDSPIQHPHHRAAQGYQGYNQNMLPAKHILYGALVGGPNSSDEYIDDVTQYQYTEVAIDYNASFVAGIAGIYKYYGGSNINMLPNVNITSPLNGDVFFEDNEIVINANASDMDGTVELVEFFKDGVKIAEDASSPYSYTLVDKTPGTYVFTAKATDNNNESRTSTTVEITIKEQGSTVPSDLKVQYRCGEPNDVANQIKPHINIINEGDNAVDMTELTVRYYYTVEAYADQVLNIDWAAMGAGNIDGRFVKMSGNKYYLEVFFTGGQVPANGQSGEMQFRIHKINWSNYTQTDDDSFDASYSDYADFEKIELYQNGNKVWPGGPVNEDPTVNLTSPIDSETFMEGADITVSADAADSDGTVALVEFFAGTVKIGEDSTAPYSIVWQDVAIGDYALTAKATDDLGASTTSVIVNIVVEQEPNILPTVTLTAPTDGESFIEGADITVSADASDTDGTITLVEFFAGTVKIGEVSTAPYSIVWQDAAVGNHAVTAKATDNKGGFTTSDAANIVVDTEPNELPTVTLTDPQDGEVISEDVDINIAADAADSDGTVELVEFYANSEKIGEDATAPYYIMWINASPDDYVITAKAIDNKGAATTSSAVNITVIGNEPPTAVITSPSNSDEFNENDDITITVDASDSDGTVELVEFYAYSTKIGEDDTAPYSIVWENVAANDYTLTAWVIDNKGAATTSSPINIKVIGEVPPSDLKLQYRCMDRAEQSNSVRAHFRIVNEGDENVPMDELEIRYYYTLENPANQEFHCDYANIGQGNVNGAFVNIIGDEYYASITFDEGPVVNANSNSGEIQTRWNKVNWSQMNQANDYSFNPDLTDFTDWENAELYRNGVKVWPGSGPVNDPPTVNITVPSNGEKFDENSDISISANASDSDGSVVLVEFFEGSTKLGEDSTAPYSVIWSNVAIGNYNLTAKATDDDGASTTSVIVAIEVEEQTIPNEKPTVSLTSPSEGDSFIEGTDVTISANAADSDGTVTLVEFYAGAAKIGEDASSPYSITWNTNVTGDYAITAKATDDKNASTISTAVNITIEEEPDNQYPVVAVTAPVNNASFTEGDDITITADASDSDGSIILVEFYEGSNKIGEDTVAPYSITWTNAADNVYSITAVATDNLNAYTTSSPINISVQPIGGPKYNYVEAMQKSIWFFDEQRCGPVSGPHNRVSWRADCHMQDGSDNGVDLTGGWHDAGDHIKFALPMSYSAGTLLWGAYEYKQAYVDSGQYDELIDTVKWATDYLIKCHTGPNEYYYQVSNKAYDHNWWGPAEVFDPSRPRPSYKLTLSDPGSCAVADVAATLALAYLVLKDEDPDYAATCLTHAEQLFTFADTTQSDSGYTAASGMYNSWSGFWDELQWAAVWLYLATDNSTYLQKAEDYVDNLNRQGQSTDVEYKWAHCWDDKHYGAMLMLARITGKQEYKDFMQMHLDWWAVDGANGWTGAGLAWLSEWGSLRYASTAAFLAFIYSDYISDQTLKNRYRNFGVNQINYILGDNPYDFSYIIGFGSDYPQHPHHRTSHGSWADSQQVPDYHRHVLYGALVGGPQSADDSSYNDDIGDFHTNEVACDYNAGITGALAKMYSLYGGSELTNFPIAETPDMPEFFVEAKTGSAQNAMVDVTTWCNNKSAFPARKIEKLSYKYFIDVSEFITAGYTADDCTASTNYEEFPITIVGPVHHSGTIYYFEIKFNDGNQIYPGGQSPYAAEIQLRISAPQNTTFFDASNDPSFQGLTNAAEITQNIPVYDDGVLIFGVEP